MRQGGYLSGRTEGGAEHTQQGGRKECEHTHTPNTRSREEGKNVNTQNTHAAGRKERM